MLRALRPKRRPIRTPERYDSSPLDLIDERAISAAGFSGHEGHALRGAVRLMPDAGRRSRSRQEVTAQVALGLWLAPIMGTPPLHRTHPLMPLVGRHAEERSPDGGSAWRS
jgi:hypothetical protein